MPVPSAKHWVTAVAHVCYETKPQAPTLRNLTAAIKAVAEDAPIPRDRRAWLPTLLNAWQPGVISAASFKRAAAAAATVPAAAPSADVSFFFQLADFAVPASWGAQSAQVLLDAPDEELLGDAVLLHEYAIIYAATQLTGLKRGESLTVDGAAYTVREVSALDDGALMRATLTKT